MYCRVKSVHVHVYVCVAHVIMVNGVFFLLHPIDVLIVGYEYDQRETHQSHI